MIRSPRLSVAIVALFGAGLGVLASCRDATEITVDVLTDDCTGLQDTGIAVAQSLETVATAESKTLSPYEGCQALPDRIGSVTIYPSGARDTAVAFKVTTGVLRPAALCEANQNVGCIVVSRSASFIPATSQHMVVRMSQKCIGVACPTGSVCAEGLCVRESDIGTNGTAVPDAGIVEGGVFGVDAASPPPPPSDASAPPTDASAPPADASVPPADAGDAGTTGNGCPGGQLPSGATACCGSVVCVDRAGNGCTCSACVALNCGAKWCCIDSSQVLSCKPNAASCK